MSEDAALTVLNLSFGQDTGGQGYRISDGFKRHAPAWNVRSAASVSNYIAFPHDLLWRRGALQRLYELADVIHCHNLLEPLRRWQHVAQRRRRGRHPRGHVLHQHGSRFRWAPEELLDDMREWHAVGIVSTIDLVQYAPDELTWVPSPYSEALLASYRAERFDMKLRIAHAPTAREKKGTADILEAIDLLRARYPRLEFDLIEMVTWRDCLRRKGQADIFIDQLTLGYGGNGVEAMGMGLPVISGTRDPWTREHMLSTWGDLPFVEATDVEGTVKAVELLMEPDARAEWGARGLAHFRRYHAEERVVELLKAIYRRAYDQREEVAA